MTNTTPFETTLADVKIGQRIAWKFRGDWAYPGLVTKHDILNGGKHIVRVDRGGRGPDESADPIIVLEEPDPTPLERLKAALADSHTARVYDDESVLANSDWLSELVLAAAAVVDAG